MKELSKIDLYILGVLGVPIIFYGLLSLSEPKVKPEITTPKYEYPKTFIPPEQPIVPFKRSTHRNEIVTMPTSSNVTLHIGGNDIIIEGITSEELINQLSLDYQDLFDYYGGAEELY